MKTYVLTATDVQGGRREGVSSNTWVNIPKTPAGTCVIGRKKTGTRDTDFNFYTTYIKFDQNALAALREKTVISISLSITAASGVLPAEGSDIFRVGYKYNDEVASETRNDAWARSIDADGTAIGTVSIGYLRNGSGGETVADNTPVVIDLTGSSIPKYGYVMGTSSSQTNLNKTVTVAPSAILTIVTDEVSTYTVDYDANGGSGAPQSQTKEAGIPLTLSSVTPKRSGYKFDAWNTAVDGTGVEYPN